MIYYNRDHIFLFNDVIPQWYVLYIIGLQYIKNL